jgi:hypothetical protein
MSDLVLFHSANHWLSGERLSDERKGKYMSVSDPGEKIEWGADSEPRKNERVPSSGFVQYLWCIFPDLLNTTQKSAS